MANPVTTVGLGSQLDIKSIVAALVSGDTTAKQSQITTQTQQTTATLSGVSVLKSALATFQSALKTLGDLKNPQFTAFSATSSGAAVTATTDGNAVAGSYSVAVKSIATGASVVTGAFANGASSAIPSGNLTITQNGIANASPLNIQIPAGATLQSVRDQINSQTLATNISANILTDSTGSRLVFSSSVIGVGSDITSTSDVPAFNIGSGAVLDPTSASSAGRIGDPPQNAEFSINGLTMTSSTNTPKGLGVAGLNLTLVAPTNGTPVNVAVSQNNDGIQKALQTFVDAYNAVVTTVAKQTTPTVDPSTGLATVAAPLTGDAMTRSMMNALSSQLFAGGGSNNGLVALSQLGITIDTSQGSDTSGQLVFDTSSTGAFTRAMGTGGLAGKVQQFFAGSSVTDTTGMLARLNGVLVPYTQTGGIFDTRNTSLTATQKDLATQQSDLDDKVKSLTDFYNAKYNAMDAVVAQLKATASSVTSFFDSLNGQKS